MAEKTVWVIDESTEPSLDQSNEPAVVAPSRGRRPKERNPAVAFSLSLLIWGGGQLYNRQYQLGLLFFLLMADFYLFTGLTVVYWQPLTALLKTVDVMPSQLLVPCGLFVLVGLLLWIVNAIQAYYVANSDRANIFDGVEHPMLPMLCSLLIPGWGQFLNGQTKKGTCYLIVTMAGLFSMGCLFLAPVLWPTLESRMERIFVERMLIAALILSPMALLMWGVSAYDALKVCLDPLKKEPIRNRVEYAMNRMRMKGWRGMIPRMELSLMFCLYLVFSLTVSHYYFPRHYYAGKLQDLQVKMTQQKMTLIPESIEHIVRAAFLKK